MGRASTSRLPSTQEAAAPPTRERLMQEALRLFSREGLNGVSLRRIVMAAGAGNPSALHYHFGTREALVHEIALHLQGWFEPRALSRLDELARRRRYTVRDVVEAVFGPALDMLLEPTLGADAIRFIGRLGWDFGPEGQSLSAEIHRKSLARALELLLPVLPQAGEEALKFRLVMCLANVYHGLAERSYLWRSPFGAMTLARKEHGARLQKMFVDYLEAGVRG